MFDIQKIGYRIKTRREELGLTLDAVASAVQVSKSTIQRYEAGLIDRPKIPVLHSIANTLGVNPDWLLGLSDDRALEDEWDWDGHPLRKIREDFGFTPDEVAEKIGISVRRYIDIESSRIRPTIPVLIELAINLCTSCDILLGIDGDLSGGKREVPASIPGSGNSNPVIARIIGIARQLPPETQAKCLEQIEALLAQQNRVQVPSAQN